MAMSETNYSQTNSIETSLWTNNSPTSSFSEQVVTINNLETYDYLKFTYRTSTSNSTSNSLIISMEDFIALKASGHETINFFNLSCFISSVSYNRAIHNYDNGQVHFNYCVGSNSTTVNTNVIPLEIIGIKYILPK